MASGTSRNDTCPCGSGLKYKHCCLGKRPPLRGKRLLWLVLLGAAAVGAAVVVGLLQDLKSGLGVGAGVLLLVAVLFGVMGPPPSSKGRSGASDINFGR